MNIAGKTILYTGAAGGLGLATTLAFLAKGATVVAVDNNADKVAALEAAAPAEARSRLRVLRSNLSDLPGFRSDIEAAGAGVGGYDIVINNAAIYPAKPFEDFTVEEHQAVQRVNV